MSRARARLAAARWAFFVLAGVAMPAASRAWGDGTFAYVMYARATETRLSLVVVDVAGARRALSPAELARGARPSLVPMLAGGDRFRVVPDAEGLRSALPALAHHACAAVDTTPRAAFVELTLIERASDGALRETRARAECP